MRIMNENQNQNEQEVEIQFTDNTTVLFVENRNVAVVDCYIVDNNELIPVLIGESQPFGITKEFENLNDAINHIALFCEA